MVIYTNTGLVKHAEKALALKTKYMWGGILRPITDAYIVTLRNIYGVNSNTGYTTARYKELASYVGKGYYGVDCVGLIKSYYWSGKADGGTGSPNYGAKSYPDINATYMFNTAKNKGTIDTMPEVPGLIVYSKSHPHVGIYIGNGYTIESTLGARGDGVVKRKLDSFWEYWFKCPYIDYVNNGTDTTVIDNGTPVKYIYQAISTAAIRTGMSKSAVIQKRVTRYMFYLADILYLKTGWFRHRGTQTYSMLVDGGSLFAKVGEYTEKTTTYKLNVRKKATLQSDIMTILNKDTKVYVWNEEPTKADGYNWYKIIIGNRIGYVAGEYLK